jgi:predicted acylesterase/phospholipase RssA
MRELKLGLALGAGGTKGAAHVGVMKVLEESGIKPDVVVGTSIGALYGACYAVGRTPGEMDEGIRTCPRRDVVAFFQHRLKIRHNNRLARRFYEALAGHSIENLPVRYATTASDMAELRQVTIDRGPVIDAVEASIAIPLIARPVMHQGRYFLDGGFWDSAPVDATADLGADVVIAVELGRPLTLPEPLRKPAVWLAERMQRMPMRWTAAGVPFTIQAVTTPLRAGRTAQVVIHPPLRRYGGIAPLHMVECLDAGINSAREALPAIRALLAGEAPVEVAKEYIPNARLVVEPGGAV